jgi:hypothetical protein
VWDVRKYEFFEVWVMRGSTVVSFWPGISDWRPALLRKWSAKLQRRKMGCGIKQVAIPSIQYQQPLSPC